MFDMLFKSLEERKSDRMKCPHCEKEIKDERIPIKPLEKMKEDAAGIVELADRLLEKAKEPTK